MQNAVQNTISDEKFKEIYTNKSFRNSIAHAHQCYDKFFNFKHYLALDGLNRYIVTETQIKEAQAEKKRAKAERVASLGNKLVFVSMGSNYAERYSDDVCSFRMRTEIQNPEGKKYFIEVSRHGDILTHFDFVIDRDLEQEYERKANFWRQKITEAGGFYKVAQSHPYFLELKKYQEQPYYWNKKHLWNNLNLKYTKTNILEVVNLLFDCFFTEIEIDNFDLVTDDYVSASPKNK
jgi:hypothetical protein